MNRDDTAPDLRGYGRSSIPSDLEAYDLPSVCKDMLGLLDALGEERAVFVRHDWGATLAWQLALAHPSRVAAVVGISVQFMPRPPAPPVELLREAWARISTSSGSSSRAWLTRRSRVTRDVRL